MPTTTYSEDEYLALLNDKHELERVVRESDAVKALKARGLIQQAKIPTSNAREREAEARRKRENAYRAALAERVIQAVPESHAVPDYCDLAIRLAAHTLFHGLDNDQQGRVESLMGWAHIGPAWQDADNDKRRRARFAELTNRELIRLFTAAAMAGELKVSAHLVNDKRLLTTHRLEPLAAAAGIDAKALRAELEREAQAKADAKAQGRAPANPAAKPVAKAAARTSPSQAAQTWYSATKQLWELLDVCSQTDAVQKLRTVVWAPVPGPDPSRPLDIKISELPEAPWFPPDDPVYGPWVTYQPPPKPPRADARVQVLLASEQAANTFSPVSLRGDQWDWTDSSDIVAYRVKRPRGSR